jgi:hypothetical protein
LLAGFAAVLALQAGQPPTGGKGQPPSIQFDKDGKPILETSPLAAKEKELAEKYSSFEKSLLILQQRLANSPDAKDRERSKQLEKVLATSGDRDVLKNFQQLIKFLNDQKLDNTGDIGKVVRVAQSLAKDLKEILDLLKSDNGAANKKDERLALEKFVKELEKVIRDEKIIRDQTRRDSTDPKKIADDQNATIDDTEKLVGKLSKDGKDGKKGEGPEPKGVAKAGGKGPKTDNTKNDANKGESSKSGDAKDGGKGDAKKGDKKPGGDGKADPKGGSKDGKEAAKAGDAKKGEGEPKAGEPKAGSPDSKADQGKTKPGKESKGQSSSKGGGQSDQSGGAKSDNQPMPPGANNPKDDVAQTKKRIQEAIEHQKQLEEEIMKGKRPEAEKEGDLAVQKLEEAKKRLEDLIRQLREEELERVLAALINRCQKMLAMQEEVLRGTLRTQTQIEATPSKKADRDHQLASLNLSDDEMKIVHEATKAIEMLETEGTAVAFPEVFQQVREDMKHVQRRLKITDVGDVTVAIEQDICETLREMIKALEKAKKDLEDKKNPPKPPPDMPPPPPQDQKLIEKLAELKMIKAMQLRVNARTELYSRRYTGEQANEDGIRAELRELSDRQDRIRDVAIKMAKGDNQ